MKLLKPSSHEGAGSDSWEECMRGDGEEGVSDTGGGGEEGMKEEGGGGVDGMNGMGGGGSVWCGCEGGLGIVGCTGRGAGRVPVPVAIIPTEGRVMEVRVAEV